MNKKILIFILAVAVVFLLVLFIRPDLFISPNDQKEITAGYGPKEGCGNLTIYVLNVSQADSILIITPKNKTLLIDSGSAINKESALRVVDFLKSKNIDRIDALIATHYHEDHIGGVPMIFSNFEVSSVYENGNCGNYTSEAQRKFQQYVLLTKDIVVKNDLKIDMDDCVAIRIIAPYAMRGGCWAANKDSNEENENSLVVHLRYSNVSFLSGGDCEEKCEQILQKRSDIAADILKLNHHGSSTSSNPYFLDVVKARYFIMSVDKEKSVALGYYHPRKDVLANIYQRSSGNNFFRTDLNGNVEIISDGRNIEVRPEAVADRCNLFSGYGGPSTNSYGPIDELIPYCS